MIKEITVTELKSWLDAKKDFQLIDVREDFEVELASIGGNHIPLNNIHHHIANIDKNRQVIVYCRSGRRSAKAIELIQEQTGQQNLFNLKGGILTWSDEIDNTIEIY